MIALTAGMSACGPESPDSLTHSDSGIRGPSWNNIRSELEQLAVSYPDHASYIEYGRTRGGRSLAALRISAPGQDAAGASRPVVLIAGTIHGDEYLGVEDKLPRWFLENRTQGGLGAFLKKGGVILMAPILNPDGYEARRRESDSGRDLNRDFDLRVMNHRGFSQDETAGLRDMVRDQLGKQGRLALTLDYHCCADSILYPWGYAFDARLPAGAVSEHKRLANIMLKQFPTYRAGKSTDILPYAAIGASDDFYHETFGASAFTFEGAQHREAGNFVAHTSMWQELFADQAAKLPDSGGAVVTAVAPVFLALGRETAAGRFEVAVSAGSGVRAELCAGAAAACRAGSAPTVASGSVTRTVAGRKIFVMGSAVRVTDGGQFSVILRDTAGSILHVTAGKFAAK
jgi:hypothetical protein